jgi:hypothetical protein
MGHFQTGYIYEAFNAFHVRYYVTEIIDGQPKRVQKSKRPWFSREASKTQAASGAISADWAEGEVLIHGNRIRGNGGRAIEAQNFQQAGASSTQHN